MNLTGQSHFNQPRIEWAIRLLYSPMPELNMNQLAQYLNADRIGEWRDCYKIFEIMMERDLELGVNSDKRKAAAAGLAWQIVSDGSPRGDRHAACLQYVYDHLTATQALDQDSTGGADQLFYQMMSAEDYGHSIHEMLLRVDNAAAKEFTYEFRHTPKWFFEGRRGYVGYLQHIFDMYGVPCVNGEWLTHSGKGWMRSLCLVFALKTFALRDWAAFNGRYGMGFLVGSTDAEHGSKEWEQAVEALRALYGDGAVMKNGGTTFDMLKADANGLPFHPMIEWCNGNYAKCYRGVDLATSSRGGEGKAPVGASLQKEESGIFLVRDALRLTGGCNERIDRPSIRYAFGEEPRAWLAILPPKTDNTAALLKSMQALAPMGLPVGWKQCYEEFGLAVPGEGEPVLFPPLAANPRGGDVSSPQAQTNENPPPGIPAPQAGTPAQTAAEEPIAPGAQTEPARLQTPDPRLPDPQVDAGSFWSRAGLMPKGADGQTLPMPSLGYALPNLRSSRRQEALTNLAKTGLANTRAAQSIRRFLNSSTLTDAKDPAENFTK